MMTAPTETIPMPISSRARSVSDDGDDDVAAKRRHSFSTDLLGAHDRGGWRAVSR